MAMLHDGQGGWSPPVFYNLGGLSLGLQAGGERREGVFFDYDS